MTVIDFAEWERSLDGTDLREARRAHPSSQPRTLAEVIAAAAEAREPDVHPIGQAVLDQAGAWHQWLHANCAVVLTPSWEAVLFEQLSPAEWQTIAAIAGLPRPTSAVLVMLRATFAAGER